MAAGGEYSGGPGLKELFQALNLGIILVAGFFLLRKPIKDMIKSRSENIGKKIIDARLELERIQHEADKARSDVKNIEDTKKRLLSEIRVEGQKLYDAMVLDAKKASERILSDARLATEQEFKAALEKIQEEIVALAVEASMDSVRGDGVQRQAMHEKLVTKISQQSETEVPRGV